MKISFGREGGPNVLNIDTGHSSIFTLKSIYVVIKNINRHSNIEFTVNYNFIIYSMYTLIA